MNRGVAASGRALAWSAAVKLVIVGSLVGAGLWRVSTDGLAVHGGAPVSLGPQGMAAAVVAAFFAFGGWWISGA